MIDDEQLQEMWAGLFASSCSENGKDDTNLIFVNILNELTTMQAKIIKYICENSSKIVSLEGLVVASRFEIDIKQLFDAIGCSDIQRLDMELDYLYSKKLIMGRFNWGQGKEGKSVMNKIVNLTPTALTLNLYVRCQGFRGRVCEYWHDYISDAEYVESNDIVYSVL